MCRTVLLLVAIALGAYTRSVVVVEASCSSNARSGYMSCTSTSLLQVPLIGALDASINDTFPVAVPVEIAVPAGSRLLGALRAVGHQHYGFNGTGWVLHNATAWLYEAGQANTVPPAIEAVVGVHFYLEQPDAEGGQPSWRLGTSRVTAKGLASTAVDSDSITWNLLQATSYQLVGGDSPTDEYSTWVGQVSSVQRLDTQRGLPPPASAVGASVGDSFSSVYAALYAFYADA